MTSQIRVSGIIFSLLMATQAFALDPVAVSKAAELTCHRIERLVTLKKIDASFQDKLYSIQIVKLKPATPTDPVFKAIALQIPGADGTFKKVEIMMDASGKGLTQNVIPGTEGTTVVWPAKDPVSLMENSLHWVLENGLTKAEIKPYYDNVSEIVLTQGKDADGKILAKVTFKISESPKLLEVILKDDGTFVSGKVL